MKRTPRSVIHEPDAAIVALLLFATAGLLSLRLSSLTHTFAATSEIRSLQSSISWRTIYESVLNAPYTGLERLIHYVPNMGLFGDRLPSVALGLTSALLFYAILRQSQHKGLSVAATLLFATSAWFMHVSRLADPEILGMVSTLVLCWLFLPRTEKAARPPLPILLMSLSLVMYVPGTIWLVVAVLIVRPRILPTAWTLASWRLRIASIVIAMVLIAPLLFSLSLHTVLIPLWLGLQGTFKSGLILHRLLSIPYELFVRGPVAPDKWIGRLPVIEILTTMLAIAGIYALIKLNHRRALMTIGVLAFVAWIVLAVGGMNDLSLLVPLVFILSAYGLAYLMGRWLEVFPRNPLARSVGILLILLLLSVIITYNLRSYFIVWPHNTHTVQAFRQHV